MRTYRNYTDEQVITYASEVKSIAGLLKKLKLKPAGGNYTSIKRILQQLNVNTSHWTGSTWNKDAQLKDWSDYTKVNSIKKHLIKKCGFQCQSCKLTTWMGCDITLELHHRDGNRTNNKIENIELLCCNCHALTHNWRNRKLVA
jgi:hypothetical protein